MKRSAINQAQKNMERLISAQGFKLPPFCQFTPDLWRTLGPEYDEIRDNRLGWDITDYGLGNFDQVGFSLITLRNGNPKDPTYPKPYAEKLLMLKEGQTAPMHFHWNKMEDIINRGGGDLLIRLYRSDKTEEFSADEIEISCDGVKQIVQAGDMVRLKPGSSITIPPFLYHDFKVEAGSGDVLIGEVSMVNDDEADNRFKAPIGRFPDIEEDEPPYRLLCFEYPPATGHSKE